MHDAENVIRKKNLDDLYLFYFIVFFNLLLAMRKLCFG